MNTVAISAKLLAAEYSPKTSRKLIAMKKIDERVKRPAKQLAGIIGVLSLLIFSSGLFMLFQYFCLSTEGHLFIGAAMFISGVLGLSFNVVIFNLVVKKAKQKYAFEIVELAKQICQEELGMAH